MESPNNLPATDSPLGGGGALFARPDNLRSDARLASQMISLGVIGLDQAERLLATAFALAEASAKKEKVREFVACMKLAVEVAKLEQNERHKILDKVAPDKHEHTHNQGAVVRQVLEEIEGDERFERLSREVTVSKYASELGGSD